MPHDDEAPLRPARAAQMLGVSPKTLARLADAGRIKVIRVPGGHRRYPLDEVARFRDGAA